VNIGVALLLILSAPFAVAANTGSFDGAWNVTVECPPHGNAGGYTYRFVAHVKDGVLHGSYNAEGASDSLALDGTIGPDGAATLHARGLTGNPDKVVGRRTRGTRYEYPVKARFEGTRGSGHRTQARPCDLTFFKQGPA
jgi:hypothetical protein